MIATSISPSIDISTTAPGVDLANVKIHYYFTADGDPSPVFNCDYTAYLNSSMNYSGCARGIFVPMGPSATPLADTYLEISFASASLPVGSTLQVNSRIHNTNYTVTYNQANDWSYLSYTGSATYVDATYITAYLNGVLAWGVEPGPPSDAGSAADAATPDADDGG